MSRAWSAFMPDSPLVVIKVGGSLLSLPDLAARLTALWQPWDGVLVSGWHVPESSKGVAIDQGPRPSKSLRDVPPHPQVSKFGHHRPDLRPVLIAGGGAAVEAVRTWDALFSLGEAASHELALSAMNVTAELLARILPRGRVVESKLAAETCWSRGELPVLRMQTWLSLPEADSDALPQSWDVTSDSLAGWVARKWHAEECWLLKSTELPPGITPTEASKTGLVDRCFPQIASEVSGLSWCNLRAAQPKLIRWELRAA